MGGQVQFRDQVVLFKDGEPRVLLWIKQDACAIRCGLAVPGMDLHYSGYKSGRRPHLTGKAGEDTELPAVAAFGPLQLSPKPTTTQLLSSFTFADIDDDWSKFRPFQPGQAANLLFVERSSLPHSFSVAVDVGDLRNFYAGHTQFDTALLILLDVSATPLIVLSVHGDGGR